MKTTRLNSGLLSAFLIYFLSAVPVLAEDMPELAAARTVYLQALNHQNGALPEAMRLFDSLLATEPANPVYISYQGACLTLQGRDAWLPWNKLKYTNQGLGRIEAALASLGKYTGGTPLEIHILLETKLVAARNFLSVPDNVFHRAADGKRLLAEITRSPDYKGMGEDFQLAVQKAMDQAKENK